jgi:hypothetical protein
MLLCFSLYSKTHAQQYYDGQWKKIMENSSRGAYKSNLPIISEIQKQAMKENNALQLIRSLKAEFNIVNQTVDDDQNNAASKVFQKTSNRRKIKRTG